MCLSACLYVLEDEGRWNEACCMYPTLGPRKGGEKQAKGKRKSVSAEPYPSGRIVGRTGGFEKRSDMKRRTF